MVGVVILGHLTGAGGLLDGLLHPLSGVDHLLAFLTVGVLATLLRRRLRWWSLPAVFVGSMAVGGTLGMAGVGLDGAETFIAASVVALGALLVVTPVVRDKVAYVIPLLAVTALFHGFAHGTELPDSAHPALYAVGFLASTSALHLSGVAAGFAIERSTWLRAALGAGIAAAGMALL
jgi:urease accessory protein